MPLYWYTDKIIGEKYRVKKPIPVEIVYNYEDTSMYMFDMFFSGADEDYDIKKIERALREEKQWGVNDTKAMKNKLLEYLEEIKSPLNCEQCGVSLDLEYPHICKPSTPNSPRIYLDSNTGKKMIKYPDGETLEYELVYGRGKE